METWGAPGLKIGYAQNSISYKGTKIWSKLKSQFKNLHWNAFQKQIKKLLLIKIKFSNLYYLPTF